MAQRRITGSRSFFPVIIANTKIVPATDEQKEKYNIATDSDPKTNWIGDGGKMYWSADFNDPDYKIWNYDHWSEIKPGGKTALYLADYLAKLIKVGCKQPQIRPLNDLLLEYDQTNGGDLCLKQKNLP